MTTTSAVMTLVMLAIGTTVFGCRDHSTVPAIPSASAAADACTPSGSALVHGNCGQDTWLWAGVAATLCPTATSSTPATTLCNNRANMRMVDILPRHLADQRDLIDESTRDSVSMPITIEHRQQTQ
ncbi:hypothetical protein [Nocardia suismassiliense]|uniref:hypothetical protein n=1 Tax=Nocardia suismassiliense TaxID=2077092 RepID=UPI001F442515|nr:hypothetical protein [Nocardia suismassiliense]